MYALLLFFLLGADPRLGSPLITTQPPTAHAGRMYIYWAKAVDLQDDPICWRLVDAPSGAWLWHDFVRPNDVILIWYTDACPPGRYRFRLVADDFHWHYDEQKWHVQLE